MCFGSGPKMPAPPPPLAPPPPQKAAAPPVELGKPEEVGDDDNEEIVSNKRKRALEIKKTQAGVKQFGALKEGGGFAAGPGPQGLGGP